MGSGCAGSSGGGEEEAIESSGLAILRPPSVSDRFMVGVAHDGLFLVHSRTDGGG